MVTSTLRAFATAATKSLVAGRAPHSTMLTRLYEYGMRSANSRCVSLASFLCSLMRAPVWSSSGEGILVSSFLAPTWNGTRVRPRLHLDRGRLHVIHCRHDL